VVAELEDYAIVRDLVVEIIAEGVEATVPATVREVVEAVAGHTAASPEGVSLAHLAGQLGIDKSAASRRWGNARRRGYLRNLESKRGMPARIVLGDPLPDEVEILPAPERLTSCCSPPFLGDEGFDEYLLAAFEAGHITDAEALRRYQLHKLVRAGRLAA
jgi:hypothetical protein